jgi:hypothetical protein
MVEFITICKECATPSVSNLDIIHAGFTLPPPFFNPTYLLELLGKPNLLEAFLFQRASGSTFPSRWLAGPARSMGPGTPDAAH